ncbi:MAG: SpoIIE family protein phosphatase [Desulfuromonadaceae bacterium]|nr:SpoIIE family protein phosphatase [Desulfuromonadaceae bacterium]
MLNKHPKVLVVDDEESVRSVICAMLEECGCQTARAEDGIEALESLDKFTPDIIFSDLNMPQMGGLELIVKLKDRLPETPIVVISGTADMQSAIEAIRRGAWEYLIKPIDFGSLQHVTNRALERARLISENRAYQEHLEDLVLERTQALRDSEKRYRTLFDKASDAIVLMQSGQIISCNMKTGALFGCNQDEVVGNSLLSFSPARQTRSVDSDELMTLYEREALDGTPQFFEWRSIRRDGNAFDSEISLTRLDLNGVAHLLAIMRDITDRKKAAAALTEHLCIMRELDMAREIQRSLLPAAPPEIPGISMACGCSPAASVGGDYYEFFVISQGVLDIVIADVAGHSFGSALLMSEARTLLHAKVRAERPPAALLTAVNELMHDDLCRAELQMSAFSVRFDLNDRMLSYANAGHTRPLFIRGRSGEIEQLDAEGMLLGIAREVEFEERHYGITDGDVLLLHTDGVVESEDASGEFFGTDRLCKLLAARRHDAPDVILAAIFEELASFVGEGPYSDDVSLVVVKISTP